MEDIVVKENKYEVSNPFSNGENFNNLFKIGQTFAKSQLVPQNYQGKPEDCMIAIDIANRMGVSPLMVMQGLYVVKGKPSWSGQTCMSMIKASKEFHKVRPVYFGTPNTDTWGCRVEAEDRETGEKVKGPEVTIQMAKAEGWYSKKDRYGNETSKWQSMPEMMLAYRAAAFFARIYIPNALMGARVEGEVEDIVGNEKAETMDPFAQHDEVVIDEEAMREAEEIFG